MMGAELEFCERLKKKLKEAVAEADRQLANDYADSFENYRHRTGIRKGFAQSLDLCAEVEREMKL